MVEIQQQGSFQFATVAELSLANEPLVSSTEAMDQALAVLQSRKAAWVACPIPERLAIIDQLIQDLYAITPRLAETEMQSKGSENSDFGSMLELLNPYIALRHLNGLKRSLLDIQAHGTPRIPGKVFTRPNGQTAALVFPEVSTDRLIFQGYTAEVWMEPGVTPAGLPGTQAEAYRQKNEPGRVALVLGAGNVISIPLTDVLYKLFVENRVVLLKMNPVNAASGPVLEQAYRALVEQGFLRFSYGGAEQGSYLCQHPLVDEIHVTGSDKTFETIVYGPGPDGALRKAARAPLTHKPVTGELGNITPIIIVPGDWTPAALDYQAEKIVSWLGTNTGFACNAPHLIVTHAGWPLRQAFLDALRLHMSRMPLLKAYYPGSKTIHQRFVSAHPEAEFYGMPLDDQLPWTLIPALSSEASGEICFQSEPFCGLIAETPIAAESLSEFLARAVDFVNQKVWGTLAAVIFVDPRSLKMPEAAASVEQAIEGLRYGSVTLNVQAPVAYALPICPWGGFPGQPLEDIQSGTGWVHNTLMFGRAQKTVVRAPFMENPKSPFIYSRAALGLKVAGKLLALEAAPSLRKTLDLIMTAMRG